jgi:hypothetical protein
MSRWPQEKSGSGISIDSISEDQSDFFGGTFFIYLNLLLLKLYFNCRLRPIILFEMLQISVSIHPPIYLTPPFRASFLVLWVFSSVFVSWFFLEIMFPAEGAKKKAGGSDKVSKDSILVTSAEQLKHLQEASFWNFCWFLLTLIQIVFIIFKIDWYNQLYYFHLSLQAHSALAFGVFSSPESDEALAFLEAVAAGTIVGAHTYDPAIGEIHSLKAPAVIVLKKVFQTI